MLWFMGLQRVGHDWVTELNRVGEKYVQTTHKTTKDQYIECMKNSQNSVMKIKVIHLKLGENHNKVSGGDEIPAELFKILKDDAVKVLHSIWKQF